MIELRNLPAPAKLNLFLHVVGRRADGYHLLESVFVLIDRQDRIDLRLRDDGRIHRITAIAGVPPEQDLCVRAARLLADETGTSLGVDIGLRKVIPMGGGLGGGSSDAATVLLGLNRLWRLNLPRRQLQSLALRLGADVPFFIHGRSAFVTGIGEVMTDIDHRQQTFVVVAPPVGVATATVFAAPELTLDTKPIKIAGFSRALEHAIENGRNDLQPVVEARVAAVAAALDALGSAVTESGLERSRVRMSGSGSCVYAALNNGTQAQKVIDRVKSLTGGQVSVWSAVSLREHPLRDLAADIE